MQMELGVTHDIAFMGHRSLEGPHGGMIEWKHDEKAMYFGWIIGAPSRNEINPKFVIPVRVPRMPHWGRQNDWVGMIPVQNVIDIDLEIVKKFEQEMEQG
jgi:hypothetical protein